jgi:hypothetical protein
MLVADYPLTDPFGSSVANETVAGRSGSYGGTPVQDSCGTDFGGGGDQFLSSSNSALAPTTTGSIMAWLRWSSTSGGSVRDWSGIPSGDNGWLIATAFSGSVYTGQISYRVGGTEVFTGLAPSYLVGYDRHWAITWDATDSRAYLDGNLLYIGPAPGSSPIVLPWTIGKNGELSEWPATHALDLRIYNHKATPSEITTVFASGTPCLPPPMVGTSTPPLRQRQKLINTPRMRQQVR